MNHKISRGEISTLSSETVKQEMRGLVVFAVLGLACAHSLTERPPELAWHQWHMKEEHDIEEFDPITFFKLHDLKGQSKWDSQDILSLYGLARGDVVGDGSGMGDHDHGHEAVSDQSKAQVVKTILRLLDKNQDGMVDAQEWVDFMENGGELPDFGYGQGHHLDFEDEYEQHHWNKYHKDQDPEVQIKHKEDIEHELLHHEHEMEESHDLAPNIRDITKNYQSPVKLENVPAKYRA